MIKYNCSYLDMYSLVDSIDRIEPQGGYWSWNLANVPKLDRSIVLREINAALREIESHVSPIKFRYTTNFKEADFKMCFTPKTQDVIFVDESGQTVHLSTPYEFDGQLGVLAMGFYPIKGQLRGVLVLDGEENWATQHRWETNEIDIQTVLLHEILHVFGLKHTTDKHAVMFAAYDGEKRKMNTDDINGIREIYRDLVYDYVVPRKSLIDKIKNIIRDIRAIFSK